MSQSSTNRSVRTAVLAQVFSYDEIRDIYTCPDGKDAHHGGWLYPHRSRAPGISTLGPECRACPLKAEVLPEHARYRRIVRDVNLNEAARDVARALAKTQAFAQIAALSQEGRDAVCAPQTHSPAWPITLRGPSGAQFEFTLAAIAQNLEATG